MKDIKNHLKNVLKKVIRDTRRNPLVEEHLKSEGLLPQSPSNEMSKKPEKQPPVINRKSRAFH